MQCFLGCSQCVVMAYLCLCVVPSWAQDFEGFPVGTNDALILNARVTPSGADTNAMVNVYVAARVGDQFFFKRSDGLWVGLTLPLPVFATRPANAPFFDFEVLDGSFSLTHPVFHDTQVYVGYGTSQQDMLDNAKYGLVHTIDNGGDEVFTLTFPPAFTGVAVSANVPKTVRFNYILTETAGPYTNVTVDFGDTVVSADTSAAKSAAREPTMLQTSVRLGSVDDPNVCQTGLLYGPFMVTANTSGPSVSPSSGALRQPSLRLVNLGRLAICMIITSPVDAVLSANAVTVRTTSCSQGAANIAGTWSGEFTCTDSCFPDFVPQPEPITLVIQQTGNSATYSSTAESFEGTVCGNEFRFEGGANDGSYTEEGVFTLKTSNTADKRSTYQNTGNACGGNCMDTLMR